MKVYRIKHKPSGLYWDRLMGRLVDDYLTCIGTRCKLLELHPVIPKTVFIFTIHQNGITKFVLKRYPKEEFEILYDEIKD